jgi:hypothetical protein
LILLKKQVQTPASLCTFFDVLWEFVKQLAIEHKAFLESLGDPFNFPEVIKPGSCYGWPSEEVPIAQGCSWQQAQTQHC